MLPVFAGEMRRMTDSGRETELFFERRIRKSDFSVADFCGV